jgi:hypothetical protein
VAWGINCFPLFKPLFRELQLMLLSAMRRQQTCIDTKSSQQFTEALIRADARRLVLATSGSFTARRMSAAHGPAGSGGVNEG